jgi:hypothetical protein
MMSHEEIVKAALEQFGCQVQKIPESTEKTPDFLVEIGAVQYVIELKTKEPNPTRLAEREEELSAGEVHGEVDVVERNNTISRVVRDAAEQLANHHGDPLRIAWLMAIGPNPSARMELFEATLYGIGSIVDMSEKGTLGDCYYFENSDFHRYREHLDGAIISTMKELTFCLNTQSPRYEELKNSPLAQVLAGAVCDPLARESRGEAYIVDGDVNRNDKEAVLGFLKNKYGKERLMHMRMNHIVATVAVPRDET